MAGPHPGGLGTLADELIARIIGQLHAKAEAKTVPVDGL